MKMEVDILLVNDVSCSDFAMAEVLGIDVSAMHVCYHAELPGARATLRVRGQKFAPLRLSEPRSDSVTQRSLDSLICLNLSHEGWDFSDRDWQVERVNGSAFKSSGRVFLTQPVLSLLLLILKWSLCLREKKND